MDDDRFDPIATTPRRRPPARARSAIPAPRPTRGSPRRRGASSSPTHRRGLPSALTLALAALLAFGSAVELAPDAAAASQTFANGATITIPYGGPYPSMIAVAGAGTTVTDVNVTLRNLYHPYERDIDVLLVGPQGQNALVMSDVGSNNDAANVTLTLNDEAWAPLPEFAASTSGSFKPTNYGGGDAFPAPAPAPAGSSALSVFDGTNPNGTWRLFVVDAWPGGAGQFAGGWSLAITTADPPNAAPVARADRLTVKAGTTGRRNLLANDRDPDGTPLTARRVTQPRHGAARVTAGGALLYKADADFRGTDSFVYEVRDPSGRTARAKVLVRIKE